MRAVAEVIGVSRSNLAGLQERPQKRIGRPPLPDDELVVLIKAVIAELPTYGYRRVHAILKRQALATGSKPPTPVVPSGGMTVASRSINAIGAGAPMVSRSAATTVRGCGSPSPWIAVIEKPRAFSPAPVASPAVMCAT